MMKQFIWFLFIVFSGVFFSACNSNTNSESGKKLDSLSVEELTNIIHKEPENVDALLIRSKKYYTNRQFKEAIADLGNVVSKDKSKADYFILLADYYLTIGQSENSKDILEKCIKRFPKNTEALIKIAQLHFFVKQYKQSLEYLNTVQELDENIPQIYFVRGLVLEESGDTSNAVINFQIATEKDPKYYEPLIILGLRYADKNDSLALSYYRNALKLKPKSVEAYYNIAMFYQKTKHYNKALSLYEEIVTKVDSSYKHAYFNMGYIYLEYLRETGKAISFFHQAANVDKDYFEAWYNLGLCYEKLGDKDKAREFYQQSLSINSEYELALNAMARIKKKK